MPEDNEDDEDRLDHTGESRVDVERLLEKLQGELLEKLNSIVSKTVYGSYRINWTLPDAHYVITRALFQADYGVSWSLPFPHLVPGLPGRRRYLECVAAELGAAAIPDDAHQSIAARGKRRRVQAASSSKTEALVRASIADLIWLDVGTGASAVYALLLAKGFGVKKILISETDPDALKHAESLLKDNNVNYEVVHPYNAQNILVGIDQPFDVMVVNPPFYSSAEEVYDKSRPQTERSGTDAELIYTNGGAKGFIQRLISESRYNDEVNAPAKIYSCLIPTLKLLKCVHTHLRAVEKVPWTRQVEFCCGKHARWVLMWRFF